MNAITKLKYIKELKALASQNIKLLPIKEKLSVIKRIKELVSLLGGTSDSVKKNIAQAKNAEDLVQLMLKCLNQGIDIPNAFKRPDKAAFIDLVKGNTKKGLEHIVKQREADGTLSILTKEELFLMIWDAIVSGTKTTQRKSENAEILELKLGSSSAIIVREELANAWLLTGWSISKEQLEELKELPPDERRAAHFNSAPTHVSPTTSRTNVGAEGHVENSTPNNKFLEDTKELESVISKKHPLFKSPELAEVLTEIHERYNGKNEEILQLPSLTPIFADETRRALVFSAKKFTIFVA